MGNSKVIFNAKVLIDLTGDTVAAAKLLEGATAHGKDGERVTGKMLDRNTVGKHGAVGMASNFPAVAITPVTRNTQAHANADGVNRLCLQPPAGYYSGESYVGESYGTVANCYIADAGTLSTRIYGAERVYGNTSAWGGNGTFTLNGSQWVSVTSGSSSYSECGAVAIYRV